LATAGLESAAGDAVLEALLAAVLAGSTPMPSLKSKTPRATTPAQLTLLATTAQVAPAVDVARCIAIDRGNHLARWLTALPPNVLGSKSYVRALRRLARQQQWDFAFLGVAALRKQNAGAFLAVAQANEHRDAGIVRLHYRGAGRARRGGFDAQSTDGAADASPAGGTFKRLALVGKGICFDTGGINLKSHKSMYQMHEDMQGSSVALGTLLALSELNVPYDVECWLAITENQTGARAFRPQDVVRAANGVSIQVVHSDAEGRMVLADTLALAARGKVSARPELIVDFATLTGACVGALTERYSGVFTNRPEWHAALEQCGRSSGERVWPFPMDEDYDSELESSIADVLQCSPDSKGDHILAARFLNRFVPAEIPWVHLDLAASHRSGGLAHVPTDFTGFGVRYATTLLLDDHLQRPVPDRHESGHPPAPRTPRPAGSRARPGAGARPGIHVRGKRRQTPS
jgi:leucyl aminopeptidase